MLPNCEYFELMQRCNPIIDELLNKMKPYSAQVYEAKAETRSENTDVIFP